MSSESTAPLHLAARVTIRGGNVLWFFQSPAESCFLSPRCCSCTRHRSPSHEDRLSARSAGHRLWPPSLHQFHNLPFEPAALQEGLSRFRGISGRSSVPFCLACLDRIFIFSHLCPILKPSLSLPSFLTVNVMLLFPFFLWPRFCEK